MSVVNAADGSADAAPDDPVSLIEQRVKDLLQAEDVPAAREVTEKALQASQNTPELLWLLAEVEFADDDQQAGIRCLAKAVDISGQNTAAISRQIQALSENDLWRETLITVEHVPAEVCGDPLIRTAIGDFYGELHCHAHAADSYGDSSGLSASTRKERRLSWLLSGGPFIFVRRRVNRWEESQLLHELREGQRASALLDALPDLDGRQAHRLKVRSENGNYEWSYLYQLWDAIGRWLLLLLPAAFLPVWLVLYAVVQTTDFISGPPGTAGGTAISAAVALGLAILLVRSQVRSDLTLRSVFRPTLALLFFLCTIAILSETAVAEGYDHRIMPIVGWWAWVVFGLAVLPAVCAAMVISVAVLTVLAGRKIGSVLRRYCQVVVLGSLLSILLDMQSPAYRLNLAMRVSWAWRLEWAARRISRDLLSSYYYFRNLTGLVSLANAASVFPLLAALPARFRIGDRAAPYWACNIAILNALRGVAPFAAATTSIVNDQTADGVPEMFGYDVLESTTMDAVNTTGGHKNLLFFDANSFIICERLGTTVVYEPLVPGTGGIIPAGVAGWYAYRRVSSDTPTATALRVHNNV